MEVDEVVLREIRQKTTKKMEWYYSWEIWKKSKEANKANKNKHLRLTGDLTYHVGKKRKLKRSYGQLEDIGTLVVDIVQ